MSPVLALKVSLDDAIPLLSDPVYIGGRNESIWRDFGYYQEEMVMNVKKLS